MIPCYKHGHKHHCFLQIGPKLKVEGGGPGRWGFERIGRWKMVKLAFLIVPLNCSWKTAYISLTYFQLSIYLFSHLSYNKSLSVYIWNDAFSCRWHVSFHQIIGPYFPFIFASSPHHPRTCFLQKIAFPFLGIKKF